MRDTVENFCMRYDAIIESSNRKFANMKKTIDFNAEPTDELPPLEYVPALAIHIPEHRFQALVEHEKWLHEAAKSGASAGAYKLALDHERECKIREEVPAVKEAYEQYKLLLSLSGY